MIEHLWEDFVCGCVDLSSCMFTYVRVRKNTNNRHKTRKNTGNMYKHAYTHITKTDTNTKTNSNTNTENPRVFSRAGRDRFLRNPIPALQKKLSEKVIFLLEPTGKRAFYTLDISAHVHGAGRPSKGR